MALDQPTYQARVSAEVRVEMARQHINAKTLAARTGISQATLSRSLNSDREFTIGELEAIAVVLDVEPSAFLPPLAVAS